MAAGLFSSRMEYYKLLYSDVNEDKTLVRLGSALESPSYIIDRMCTSTYKPLRFDKFKFKFLR